MDASEGEVFIAVYHNKNFTNLYISDETGIYYSLTLEDVIANDEVNWDAGNGVFDVHVVWIDIVCSKHVHDIHICYICDNEYLYSCARIGAHCSNLQIDCVYCKFSDTFNVMLLMVCTYVCSCG